VFSREPRTVGSTYWCSDCSLRCLFTSPSATGNSREERRHGRLASIYEDYLLLMRYVWRHWNSVHPFISNQGDAPLPPWDDDRLEILTTRLQLHASAKVLKLREDWGETLLELQKLDMAHKTLQLALQTGNNDPDQTNYGFGEGISPENQIRDAIDALDTKRRVVEQQMRDEFRGRRALPWRVPQT